MARHSRKPDSIIETWETRYQEGRKEFHKQLNVLAPFGIRYVTYFVIQISNFLS